MTEFTPAPDFAVGPDIPESGYVVKDLGGGAHFVTHAAASSDGGATKNTRTTLTQVPGKPDVHRVRLITRTPVQDIQLSAVPGAPTQAGARKPEDGPAEGSMSPEALPPALGRGPQPSASRRRWNPALAECTRLCRNRRP
jgi:hypothetical protein